MKRITAAILFLMFSSLSFTAIAQRAAKKTAEDGYGKNLLTISPIGLTDRGLSLGLCYERALDDKGILNFSLPVFYTFNSADDNYYYYNNGYNKQPSMFYAYPGIKVYPTGAYGIVRYGIGPSFVIAAGKTYENRDIYDPNTGQYIGSGYVSQNRFIFGVMVTNSLNVNFKKKFYLGTELGLGLSYVNTIEGRRDGTTGLARIGFSFGYRF